MKRYRLKRFALVGLLIAVSMFAFRASAIPTGDMNTQNEEIVNAQHVMDLFIDSITAIFTSSISVVQLAKDYKKNRVAFWLDAMALVCSVLSLLSWPAVMLWQEHSDSLGLIFVCLRSFIAPAIDESSESESEGMKMWLNRWLTKCKSGKKHLTHGSCAVFLLQVPDDSPVKGIKPTVFKYTEFLQGRYGNIYRFFCVFLDFHTQLQVRPRFLHQFQ